MDRSLMMFWAGMVLMFALFIPLTLLQDSGPSAVAVAKGKKGGGGSRKKLALMEDVQDVTVRFSCLQRRRKGHGDLHRCQVFCPTQVQLSSVKERRALLKCFRGKWTALRTKKARRVVRRSVTLVEQQSAPPELLNTLMNSYFNLSHNYLAMAYFFDRADVQLPGFHRYFLHLWQNSVDQARSIMAYINKRGGWIDMQELPSPELTDTLTSSQEAGRVGLVAMEMAVTMETESQTKILKVTEQLEKPKNKDPHLMHVLEDKYMDYHVKMTKELMDHVTQLRTLAEAGEEDYRLGEYEMDGLLQQ